MTGECFSPAGLHQKEFPCILTCFGLDMLFHVVSNIWTCHCCTKEVLDAHYLGNKKYLTTLSAKFVADLMYLEKEGNLPGNMLGQSHLLSTSSPSQSVWSWSHSECSQWNIILKDKIGYRHYITLNQLQNSYTYVSSSTYILGFCVKMLKELIIRDNSHNTESQE